MKLPFYMTMMAVISVFIFGCAHCSSTPNPPIPNDSSYCAAACTKMFDLGCEEGQPLDTPLIDGRCTQGMPTDDVDGGIICRTECAAFCESIQSSLVWLHPKCIVEKVTQCSEIETLCNANPTN
jgi:hypothetical protein